MSVLWTEKYRPKTPEELEAPPHIKRFLKHAIANGHPHLLLYGPPGTGKTTFATMLNPTLTLNASDERGIEVVRNKIKKVANTLAKQVIVLDECENLSKDAQTCLRRVMEDFHNTTFIFCTNYYTRIINPLKSRLLKFKFVAHDSKVLTEIADREGLGNEKDFYKNLFTKCNGDLRRCINVMQGMNPLLEPLDNQNENTPNNNQLKTADFEEQNPTISKINNHITSDFLDDFIGRVPTPLMHSFKSMGISNYRELVSSFIGAGYSVLQLIHQLVEHITGTETQKSLFSLLLSECEGYCTSGCSDELVLAHLCLGKIKIY